MVADMCRQHRIAVLFGKLGYFEKRAWLWRGCWIGFWHRRRRRHRVRDRWGLISSSCRPGHRRRGISGFGMRRQRGAVRRRGGGGAALRVRAGKPPDDVARCRHVGKVGKADDQHLGRRWRLRRACDLAMTFQQHLPGPAETRNAEPGQRFDGLNLRFQQCVHGPAGRLQTGAMDKVQQVGEDHVRLGAAGKASRKRRQRRCGVAAHRRVENGDRVAAAGAPQHLGDTVDCQPVGGHRRRLVEK